MTAADILKKYDGNQDHCDAIIQAKNADPILKKTHIKAHPDAPECKVAWLSDPKNMLYKLNIWIL